MSLDAFGVIGGQSGNNLFYCWGSSDSDADCYRCCGQFGRENCAVHQGLGWYSAPDCQRGRCRDGFNPEVDSIGNGQAQGGSEGCGRTYTAANPQIRRQPCAIRSERDRLDRCRQRTEGYQDLRRSAPGVARQAVSENNQSGHRGSLTLSSDSVSIGFVGQLSWMHAKT